MNKSTDIISRKALPAALFTIFIDAVGIAILIPVMIALVLPGKFQVIPSTWDVRDGFIMVAWLAGTFSLCTFLAAPILGQLSDNFGRKKILSLSLLGTSIGYVIFALGVIYHSIPLLFLGRIIDGLTGGNIAIGRAIIADISTPKTRTRNFGLIGAMFGIGFVLGPYIGGRLSSPGIPLINVAGHTFLTTPQWFSPATPFWFAAILAGINVLLATFVLPETLKHRANHVIQWHRSFLNVKKGFTMPGIRNVLPVSFLFTAGFTFFTTFFSFSLVKRIPGFTPANVADYFSLIGIWIAVFQGGLIPIVAKKLKNHQVIRFSLFGASASVILILTATTTKSAIFLSPFVPLFVALTMANMISLISSVADSKVQGEVMGINSSVEALAQAIPAILSGYIAGVAVWLPTVVSSVVLATAGILFWILFKPSMIKQDHGFAE